MKIRPETMQTNKIMGYRLSRTTGYILNCCDRLLKRTQAKSPSHSIQISIILQSPSIHKLLSRKVPGIASVRLNGY
jgi:hypothetical protein